MKSFMLFIALFTGCQMYLHSTEGDGKDENTYRFVFSTEKQKTELITMQEGNLDNRERL